MSLDTTKIGEVAAELMEALPNEADGRIVAVGLVVIVDNGDGTYTRVKTSDDSFYVQLGLFHAALSVVTDGEPPDD